MDNKITNKLNQRFRITYIPTNQSITIRLNSKDGAGVLDAVKEEFEAKFNIIDEDRTNYKVDRINLEVIELPCNQKVAAMLTKTSIQLPIDVLRELNNPGSEKPVVNIPSTTILTPKPIVVIKPIVVTLTVKKGDKVELTDGRQGYIVKYSSNNDIKIFAGELNQELFNKNIHPSDYQINKTQIKSIINN